MPIFTFYGACWVLEEYEIFYDVTDRKKRSSQSLSSIIKVLNKDRLFELSGEHEALSWLIVQLNLLGEYLEWERGLT